MSRRTKLIRKRVRQRQRFANRPKPVEKPVEKPVRPKSAGLIGELAKPTHSVLAELIAEQT
jgi:hypothetical protein